MPEINLRVKIIGGKKTSLKIYVASMSETRKPMVLANGVSICHEKIEFVIRNAIVEVAKG